MCPMNFTLTRMTRKNKNKWITISKESIISQDCRQMRAKKLMNNIKATFLYLEMEKYNISKTF